MDIISMTRRTALERGAKGALALLTVSITARSLGLPAVAQVPQKFVIGSQPINPLICSYIGAVDFFKDEGLSAEVTRFQNGPAMNPGNSGGQRRRRRYRASASACGDHARSSRDRTLSRWLLHTDASAGADYGTRRFIDPQPR